MLLGDKKLNRINLYNYRIKEINFGKLRVYFFLGLGIVLSLFLNFIIYGYYEIHIIHQDTRNAFLAANINIVNTKLKPIKEFDRKVELIRKQVRLLQLVEDKRDDTVTFFQQLGIVTPEQVYYKQITWNGIMCQLTGTAASPLYLASLLDKLRDKNGIFANPELVSNNLGADGRYDFMITVQIKPNLVAIPNAES